MQSTSIESMAICCKSCPTPDTSDEQSILKFEVILDNPSEAYMPGTLVNGCVTIIVKNFFKVSSVKLEIVGEGEVKWTDCEFHHDSAGKANAVSVVYRSSEQYCSFNRYFISSDYFGTFLRGYYIFRFSYKLPFTIPSSYEGQYGHVRYTCKAIINRYRSNSITFRKIFTVNGLVDLNAWPELFQPANGQDVKYLCCCCCKSGPLTYTVTIDKRAYVPGEIIRSKIEVVNKTDTEVYLIKAKLLITTSFYAKGSLKYSGGTICKMCSTSRVTSNNTDVYSDITIKVPPLPPSELIGCGIIKISYCIKLDICIGGLSENVHVLIPVNIGTIPYKQTFKYLEPSIKLTGDKFWVHHFRNSELRNKHIRSFSVPEQLFEVYPEYPPPVTANYVLGTAVIPHEDKNSQGPTLFIPQYLIYKTKDL